MTNVFIWRDKIDARGEVLVNMDAEIGVILTQTKEDLEPSETARGNKGLFSRALSGSTASRTIRECTSAVLSHRICGNLL